MIKIFHLGDVHLDSPFSGGDLSARERKRAEARELFARVTEYIKNGGYDLVLISGDLYEGESLTREGADFLRAQLGSLDCPVVIAPGNHDPYLPGSFYAGDLPKNLFVFSGEELSHFDFEDKKIRVYGYAFTGNSYRKNPLAGFEGEDSGMINILCAHGDVASPVSPYAPLSVPDMERAGFAYCALSHIHRPPQMIEGETCIAYSGFLCSRGFDETGDGGAVSVSIFDRGDSVKAVPERVRFAGAKYEIETADISGSVSDLATAEILRRLIARKDFGSETSLRILLCGNISRDYRPDTRRLAAELADGLALLEIRDNTLPLLDTESLENDMTVMGELYRGLKAKMLEGSERERRVAAMALRLGLAALEDREITPILGISGEEGED